MLIPQFIQYFRLATQLAASKQGISSRSNIHLNTTRWLTLCLTMPLVAQNTLCRVNSELESVYHLAIHQK